MSVVQRPNAQERQPTPSVLLASNNPFRQFSADPDATSPRERPKSRNPFLDGDDDDNGSKSPVKDAFGTNLTVSGSMGKLSLSDNTSRPPPQPTRNGQPPQNRSAADGRDSSNRIRRPGPPPFGRENPSNGLPPRRGPTHSHTRSDEDRQNPVSRGPGNPSDPTSKNGPVGRPPRPYQPRPSGDRERGRVSKKESSHTRSNSESSIMVDSNGKSLPEREGTERRRRMGPPPGRDGLRPPPRDGRGKPRDPSSKEENREKSSKSRSDRDKRKPRTPLDTIDMLDVTGVYGLGSFHHDGPFDACNPHRNKNKNNKMAPIHAFPENSANNALAGFIDPNQKMDISKYHGNRDPEAYNDFSMPAATGPRRGSQNSAMLDIPKYRPTSGARALSFDPVMRAEPVHGDESLGLGTSTFLEGAPAPASALQRTFSNDADGNRPGSSQGNSNNLGGGLSRKKSLAQKIRSLSSNRTENRPAMPTPSLISGRPTATSPLSPGSRKESEKNPFFNEYDQAYEKKKEAIAANAAATSGDEQKEELTVKPRERTLSSPRKKEMPPISKVVSGDLIDTRTSIEENKEKNSSEGETAAIAETMAKPRRSPPPPPIPQANGAGGGGILKRVKSLTGRRRGGSN